MRARFKRMTVWNETPFDKMVCSICVDMGQIHSEEINRYFTEMLRIMEKKEFFQKKPHTFVSNVPFVILVSVISHIHSTHLFEEEKYR